MVTAGWNIIERERHVESLGTGLAAENPRFDAWDKADSVVMTWPWNLILPEIEDTCM